MVLYPGVEVRDSAGLLRDQAQNFDGSAPCRTGGGHNSDVRLVDRNSQNVRRSRLRRREWPSKTLTRCAARRKAMIRVVIDAVRLPSTAAH